jgi:hypothetical protein
MIKSILNLATIGAIIAGTYMWTFPSASIELPHLFSTCLEQISVDWNACVEVYLTHPFSPPCYDILTKGLGILAGGWGLLHFHQPSLKLLLCLVAVLSTAHRLYTHLQPSLTFLQPSVTMDPEFAIVNEPISVPYAALLTSPSNI